MRSMRSEELGERSKKERKGAKKDGKGAKRSEKERKGAKRSEKERKGAKKEQERSLHSGLLSTTLHLVVRPQAYPIFPWGDKGVPAAGVQRQGFPMEGTSAQRLEGVR